MMSDKDDQKSARGQIDPKEIRQIIQARRDHFVDRHAGGLPTDAVYSEADIATRMAREYENLLSQLECENLLDLG